MTPLLTGVFASQISGHLDTFTPTGSFDAIASYTVPSGGASTVTFNGIPSGYKHLQLRISAACGTNQSAFNMVVNGDTTNSNYRYNLFGGDGSLAYQTGNNRNMGAIRNTYFSGTILNVRDYNSNSKYKTFQYLSGVDQSSAGFMTLGSNLWLNTNQITSLSFTEYSGTNFIQNSKFSLYGIRG